VAAEAAAIAATMAVDGGKLLEAMTQDSDICKGEQKQAAVAATVQQRDHEQMICVSS
jgi:hypothetical protein